MGRSRLRLGPLAPAPELALDGRRTGGPIEDASPKMVGQTATTACRPNGRAPPRSSANPAARPRPSVGAHVGTHRRLWDKFRPIPRELTPCDPGDGNSQRCPTGLVNSDYPVKHSIGTPYLERYSPLWGRARPHSGEIEAISTELGRIRQIMNQSRATFNKFGLFWLGIHHVLRICPILRPTVVWQSEAILG